MASTQERIISLIAANLEVDGKPVDASADLSNSLSDLGVSSMDVVSFGRVIQDEFGIKLTPECCAELNSVGQLIEFLEANAA